MREMTTDEWCPFNPGEVWRLRYHSGCSQTLHVRTVVDDAVVVFRVFSRGTGWRYRLEEIGFLRIAIERGNLKRVRK